MNEIEEIQELLKKYRAQRTDYLQQLGDKYSNQTPAFNNGRITVLDHVIDDLREIVLADTRSGV